MTSLDKKVPYGTCTNCGAEHQRYRDREHTKFQSYCHACHAVHMRKTRPKHCDLPDESRKRANARSYANTYQRRGKLKPEPCEVCGSQGQKHHDDYDKPLEVRWLCREHHLEHHA